MNTTTAATQAGVTTATIRTWCRIGAVAAVKTAGRWVISASSLARRIALSVRTSKEKRMDLNASRTDTYATGPRTITTKVRTNRRGITMITGLAPLLGDEIDAIADPGDRLHTLEVLFGSSIAIRPEPADIATSMITSDGRVSTEYAGTPHLPVDRVLALGHQIREHLGL